MRRIRGNRDGSSIKAAIKCGDKIYPGLVQQKHSLARFTALLQHRGNGARFFIQLRIGENVKLVFRIVVAQEEKSRLSRLRRCAMAEQRNKALEVRAWPRPPRGANRCLQPFRHVQPSSPWCRLPLAPPAQTYPGQNRVSALPAMPSSRLQS